jgi:hypothetical protein
MQGGCARELDHIYHPEKNGLREPNYDLLWTLEAHIVRWLHILSWALLHRLDIATHDW